MSMITLNEILKTIERDFDRRQSVWARTQRDNLSDVAMQILSLQSSHERLARSHPESAEVLGDLFFAMETTKSIRDEFVVAYGNARWGTGEADLEVAAIVSAALKERDDQLAALSAQLAKLQEVADNRETRACRLQEQIASLQRRAQDAESRITEMTKRAAIHPETRAAVWAMTNGHCYYCDVEMVMCANERTDISDMRPVFHVDHLVPKDRGGPDNLSNFVPACAPCNMAKANKPYIEFIRDQHARLKLVVSA